VHLFELIWSNEIGFAMRRNVNLDNVFLMHDATEWVVESKQKLIFLLNFENIAIRLIKRVSLFSLKMLGLARIRWVQFTSFMNVSMGRLVKLSPSQG